MRGSDAFAAVCALLWLVMAASGADLVGGVITRTGHAEVDQWVFGIFGPLGIAIVIVAAAWLSHKFRRFDWASGIVSTASIFLLLAYCVRLGAGI